MFEYHGWVTIQATDDETALVERIVERVRRAVRDFGDLDLVDPKKIFIVQLADFMWRELPSREERIDTARHFRVFPGEGVHGAEVAELVRRVDDMGYRGDYSFEVFNDDYVQLPASLVAARARQSVKRLTDHVSRRSLPMRRVIPAP